MSDSKLSAQQLVEKLADACLDDLLQLSPAEALQEFSPPAEDAVEFDQLLIKAKVEGGRRRLAAAKEALAGLSPHDPIPAGIDIATARRKLAEAANDSRFTLAARDLRELPDEEVIRLYLQIEQLQDDTKKEDA